MQQCHLAAAENWTEKGAHSGAKGAENGAKQLAFSGLQIPRDCTSVPEKENAGTIDNIRRSGVFSCKLSGEGGIRTPGTVAGTPVFETGTFGRSATSPGMSTFLAVSEKLP